MTSRYLVLAISLLISGSSYCEDIHCKKISYQLSVKCGAEVALPCLFNSTGHLGIILVWQIDSDRPVLSANATSKAVIQGKSFQGRARVPQDWYRSGNATLQISRLQANDKGTYECFLRGEGTAALCATLRMEVVSAGHSQSYGPSCAWMPVLLLAWGMFSF